jgi:hypothetical protein
LTKNYYIFIFILIGAVLGGNLAFGGYFQDNGKLRAKTLTKPAQFQKYYVISSYEPFLGESPVENDFEPLNANSPEYVFIPEKELKIRQEAVCDFLESERPEKYSNAGICQNDL